MVAVGQPTGRGTCNVVLPEHFKEEAKDDFKEGGFAVPISVGLAHLQSHEQGPPAVLARASSTSHADSTGRHPKITSLGLLLEVDGAIWKCVRLFFV